MNTISTWMSVGCLSVALLAVNVAAASRPPIPPDSSRAAEADLQRGRVQCLPGRAQ